MIIQISRGLRVVANDGLNFTLERRHVSEKTNAITWQFVGYYADLGEACRSAVRKSFAGAPDGPLQAAIAAEGRAADRLEALYAKLREVGRPVEVVGDEDAPESLLGAAS